MFEKKCCSMTAICTTIIGAITTLVLIIIIMKSTSREKDLLSSMSDNLNSTGYTDILRSDSFGNCPSNYQPLFNFEIGAFKRKCLCKNRTSGYYQFRNLLKGRCSSSSSFSCSLFKMDNTQFKIYRGVILCGLKSQYSYESYTYSPHKSNCPIGTRVCGKDEKGYLCLNSTYKCPINFIEIVSGSLTANPISMQGEKVVTLSSNSHLVFSNENYEGNIIVQFDWSFENRCLDSMYKQMSNKDGLNIFEDEKDWVEQCPLVYDSEVDPRWQVVDQMPFRNWLNDNIPVFRNMQSSHLLDVDKLQVPFSINSVGYMHFNKKCKWFPNESSHSNIQKLVTKEKYSIRGVTISVLVFTIIIIIISILFFCLMYSSTNEPESTLFCCGCVCFLLVIVLIMVILLIIGNGNNFYLKESQISENCFGKYSSKQLLYMKQNNTKMDTLIYSILGIVLLSMTCLSISQCCYVSRSKRYKPLGGHEDPSDYKNHQSYEGHVHNPDKPYSGSSGKGKGKNKGGKLSISISFDGYEQEDEDPYADENGFGNADDYNNYNHNSYGGNNNYYNDYTHDFNETNQTPQIDPNDIYGNSQNEYEMNNTDGPGSPIFEDENGDDAGDDGNEHEDNNPIFD